MNLSMVNTSAAIAVACILAGEVDQANIAAVTGARDSGGVQQSQPVNETARVMSQFRSRVDDYVALRKRAAKDAPAFKETNDPAKIKAAQEALAARIRVLRAGARPGDVFVPEVRPVFRRLLASELKGEDGRDAKAILKDDAPPSVPLKINEKYPEKAPLPTVPVNILTNLPPLPKEVEYRLVRKDLLLFDPEAEIIVDYIARAMP
jgi:hypothetical protein